MLFPDLPETAAVRQTVDTFLGLHHAERIAQGEFYEMENLSGDRYPALAPRLGREVCPADSPGGLIAKDALCLTDGTDFVMNGYHVNLNLTPGPKQLASMGAYVVILPDRKWINTLDLTQHGSIDACYQSSGPVELSLCALDGTPYADVFLGDTPPEEGTLWMDTAQRPHVLKRWSAASESWTAVAGTYVKLSAPGIGAAFEVYDGVSVSGLSQEGLNGSHVIWGRGEDWLLIPGVLDAPVQEAAVEVRRQMPQVDFLIESGNRLWGCRYGLDSGGRPVNEIYASKLGDFKNWSCFLGASTDSYAASCGTDGPFTGAVSYQGYPHFFKEDCLHKVFGSYPAAFQIQTTQLLGVARGCGGSLVRLGDSLYYNSPSGVCAYRGGAPQVISQALGREVFPRAVAGATADRLYLSMTDRAGAAHLFVYDPARGLWHREDDLGADAFCFCAGSLYAIAAGKLLRLTGQQDPSLSWRAVTGELGLTDPEARMLTRLTLRLRLDPGAQLRIAVRYDDGPGWEELAGIRGRDSTVFRLPIPVRRCRHLRLRLEGIGWAVLHSLTLEFTGGGSL